MKYFTKILLSLMSFMFIMGLAYNYKQSRDDIYNYKIYNDSINKLSSVIEMEDSTIFNIDYKYGWNNPRVNCYMDIEIPLTSKIDVSKFTMPIDGDYIITSNYGYRSQFGRMHYGIDFGLKIGDTIRTSFDGIVRIVNCDDNGYGKYVIIRHKNGVETVYAHLSKYLVNRDQKVSSGQIIGLGGNTGRSTNPHLHFEIRYLGIALNPSEIIDFNVGKPIKDIYNFNKINYKKYIKNKREEI